MAIRRNIIVSVVTVLLLLGGITWGCLFYLSHEQDEREAYVGCHASHYISHPTRASVYLVNDACEISWGDLPQLSDALLPPLSIWHNRTADAEKPLHIVRYSSIDVAVWCAVTSADVTNVVRFIADSMCGGYEPVEEKMGGGKMLHFATNDNRFLHLYVAPGVVGCSYRERLLLPTDADTTLSVVIDELQRLSNCGVLYYADGYRYNDIYKDGELSELRFVTDVAIEGLGEAMVLDTTMISRRAVMAMQLHKPYHEALSPVATLAYLPSPTDSAMLDCVVAIPIVQPAALSQELLWAYTPYGYRADSVMVKRWLAPELVTAEYYWLTAREGVLYASPSHDAMWAYAADMRKGDCMCNPSQLSSASLTVVGDSIDVSLLPLSVVWQLPVYLTDTDLQSVQIAPNSKGWKYSVRVWRTKK